AWCGLEDPHRRGGLGRRGEDSWGEVEDERPSLNEIVADRPPARGQNREEVRVGRRIQVPHRPVVRGDRIEGRPVPPAGILEEGGETVAGGQRSGEVPAEEHG